MANDGTIRKGDARVTFEHAFDMKQVGEPVRIVVWRDGREQSLDAPARRIARYDRNRNRYGVAPRYVVYAGLVFMPLDAELLKTLGRGWPQTADRNLVWHQLFREAERPENADREVVVLTRVLRHSVNSQMAFPRAGGGRANQRRPDQGPDRRARRPGRGARGRFSPSNTRVRPGSRLWIARRPRPPTPKILKQYGIPKDRNL